MTPEIFYKPLATSIHSGANISMNPDQWSWQVSRDVEEQMAGSSTPYTRTYICHINAVAPKKGTIGDFRWFLDLVGKDTQEVFLQGFPNAKKWEVTWSLYSKVVSGDYPIPPMLLGDSSILVDGYEPLPKYELLDDIAAKATGNSFSKLFG